MKYFQLAIVLASLATATSRQLTLNHGASFPDDKLGPAEGTCHLTSDSLTAFLFGLKTKCGSRPADVNADTFALLSGLVKSNSLQSIKLVIPSVRFRSDKSQGGLLGLAFDAHKTGVFEYLLGQWPQLHLQNMYRQRAADHARREENKAPWVYEAWDPESPWKLDDLKALVDAHPARAQEILPNTYEPQRVPKLVDFIIYAVQKGTLGRDQLDIALNKLADNHALDDESLAYYIRKLAAAGAKVTGLTMEKWKENLRYRSDDYDYCPKTSQLLAELFRK